MVSPTVNHNIKANFGERASELTHAVRHGCQEDSRLEGNWNSYEGIRMGLESGEEERLAVADGGYSSSKLLV